jgi:hypothetical protein
MPQRHGIDQQCAAPELVLKNARSIGLDDDRSGESAAAASQRARARLWSTPEHKMLPAFGGNDLMRQQSAKP